MELLITFTLLTIVNVIFSTIKSIITIKGSPLAASLISACYYSLYNVVLIYTVANFPMWQKVAVTFLCNLVGVYIVKYLEAKSKKDKLWLVKFTIPSWRIDTAKKLLDEADIPYNYYDLKKYYVIDTYCSSQKETSKIIDICNVCEGKAFATENKLDF